MIQDPKKKDAEFAEVVREEQAGLRYFIRSLGVRYDWVDDLAQESFVVAYRRWQDLDSPSNAGYWLRSIARNLVMNEISKSSRRQRLMNENLTTILINYEDSNPKGGDLADSQIRYQALQNCLQELSEKSAEVVRERYFNDLNSTEIAEKLAMSSSAVRKVLFNSRKALATCLLKQTVFQNS